MSLRPSLLLNVLPTLLGLALPAGPLTAQRPAPSPGATATSSAAKRPMTWLDMQHMSSAGSPSVSPDGKWVLYTVTTPSWKDATTQTDIHVVSAERGVTSSRQLTFTKNRNETQPRWSPDGQWFVFVSNRDAAAQGSTAPAGGGAAGAGGQGGGASGNQLYLMRIDGGEARKITEAQAGVSTFAFSRDGRWLVYRSGRPTAEQLHALPVADLAAGREATAQQLTRHPTGVGQWQFSPDAKRIYFVTADTVDRDERTRSERRFTVAIRNPAAPTSSLWALDLDGRKTTRLTTDTSLSVTDFVISDDSRWIGYRALPSDRYKRGITEQGIHSNLYLLETASGRIEQLTGNEEVAESALSFSPDSRWIAFSASDDTTRYTMKNSRVYLRRVDDARGQWRKLGADFDGDVSIGFWSRDGRTIYFNEGVRATNQVLAVDVASGKVRPVTSVTGVVSADQDDDSRRIMLTYADPKTPNTIYTVASVDRLGDRNAWVQLSNLNPQAAEFALGDEEEITWTSKDGTKVGGVLVKPVGYQAGKRYPLIVAIHGGPASADVLGFNGGYGAQVYAGAGYVVLKPNYRGSTNYGEAFKNGIVGNYFDPGYQDIMTGVDHLIAQGLVDSTQMGVLGWSAGGHWSNWILTHTDRFKAISSGAGTSNWISMYAQSDVQRNRQYYLGDKLPYDDFEAYWNQSPIKYIRNAKTPTMIHVVEGDPRVPSPQSVELHMALKKLGVPTELFVYPGNTHGIPDARNRLLKSTAEMMWMDYYVRNSGRKFAWRDVLKTVDEERAANANQAAEATP